MKENKELISTLIRKRINKKHTKKLIRFLKEYTYTFNQLAPTRLQGNRKKYFESLNIVTNKDFSNAVKYIKNDIFSSQCYEYKLDGTVEFDKIKYIYNLFENKKGNYAIFKNSQGYKQLESFFIRLSNAFNHNNFVCIRERLFIWNQHGNKIQGVFVMCFKDFDRIMNYLKSM